MSDHRLKITVTDEERDVFDSCKVRKTDPLAGTIVRLALEQAKFLQKAASGAFKKSQPTGRQHYDEQPQWRDTSSSQE